MGRNPKLPNVATKKERAYLSDSVNPSVGGGAHHENTNQEAELQSANRNPLRRVEWQHKMLPNSGNVHTSRKGKKTKTVSVNVRRSVRLQGTVMPVHDKDIERVINEITLSESEKEEDEPPADTKQPDPSVENKSLEDKINHLVQLLEEQRDRCSPGETPSPSYARYKSWYIDSQKKIGALSEENQQLTKKLEIAQGKLEAYENGARAPLEVLEKFKDAPFFSNPTRVAERAGNAFAQIIYDVFTSQDAGWEAKTSLSKRRKLCKRNEKEPIIGA